MLLPVSPRKLPIMVTKSPGVLKPGEQQTLPAPAVITSTIGCNELFLVIISLTFRNWKAVAAFLAPETNSFKNHRSISLVKSPP